MGLFKNGIVAVLAVLTLNQMYFFLLELGIGVHHNNVRPGPCRIVPGVTCGSEEISVTDDGLAFITSGLRSLTRCNTTVMRGHLFIFDFNNPDANAKKLKIIGEGINLESFSPHGMDILEEADGIRVHVYVINHADGVESVEVFEYDRAKPNEITHRRRITDEKFVCINSLALVDQHHFYITNFQKYCELGTFAMEALLGLKSANFLYYKNGQTNIIEEGYFFNGITLSKSRNEVVVNHGGKKRVEIYEINHSNGQLSFKTDVFIGYVLDNIYLDKQTGDFYVAYFKNGLLGLFWDFCSSSGAVLSAKNTNFTDIKIEEEFHDSGEKFVSGASSFVHYKGQYLVGTVFNKLGYCARK